MGFIGGVSPQHKYLIRKSFAALEAHGPVPGLVFYRRLFEIQPGLKAMFTSDIGQQAAKLMDMLGALIASLDRTAALETELRMMGARHAEYGVKPEHYDLVGQALLGMLAEMLRGDFTPEAREAWTTLYGAVAEAMMAGAQPVKA